VAVLVRDKRLPADWSRRIVHVRLGVWRPTSARADGQQVERLILALYRPIPPALEQRLVTAAGHVESRADVLGAATVIGLDERAAHELAGMRGFDLS
jgi:hypothetical protein